LYDLEMHTQLYGAARPAVENNEILQYQNSSKLFGDNIKML